MLYTSFENFKKINETVNNNIVNDIILKYQNINSEEDIKNFVNDVYYKLDISFHPDDSFNSYISTNNQNTFSDKEAKELDNIVDNIFSFCQANGLDFYEISLPIQQKRIAIDKN